MGMDMDMVIMYMVQKIMEKCKNHINQQNLKINTESDY